MRSWFHLLKIFIFCCLCGLSACNKNAVSLNIELLPAETDHNLYDVLFVDSLHGFMVGGERYASSDLLYTADGGQNWTLTQLPPEANKAVYAIAASDNRVQATGFDGKLFNFDSEQESWGYSQTNWWEWFQGIFIHPSGNTFIVGGVGYANGRILQIDVSGQVVQADSFDFELTDICFANSLEGYACGYGAVLKTNDAGRTWEQLHVKGDYYKSLYYRMDGSVWAVGYNGSIMHSDDGGMEWKKDRTGGNIGKNQWRLRDIAFLNNKEGFAVGDRGLIVQTSDGGNTWNRIISPSDADLHAVAFQAESYVWVVGNAGTIIKIKL